MEADGVNPGRWVDRVKSRSLKARYLTAISLSAVAAAVAQVGQKNAALAFVAPGLVNALEYRADVRVALEITCIGLELD